MKIQKTLGVIGVGNMGGAIIEGLLSKKLMMPKQIYVFDKVEDKLRDFAKKYRVQKVASNQELVRKSQVVLLAIKPQDLFKSALDFKSSLKSTHLLISILAGTPIAKLKKAFGNQAATLRAMPNLGAKVGASITALAGVSGEKMKLAELVFSGCGKTIQLPEKQFDLVTALSGSGPAYFFLLMEQMMEKGIRSGLTSEQAKALSVQTAVGAGLLAAASEFSPADLRKMVTSKGGTTEAALNVLLKRNFNDLFDQALQAALERGRELSQ